MRPLNSIERSIKLKWPSGYAKPRHGGIFDRLNSSIATGLYEGEIQCEKIFQEIHPRAANLLIDDFERVLGPDPCLRDENDRSLDQRQRQAWQRWIARGGQSISYFMSLSAMLGFEIKGVEEFWPSVAGNMRAGEPLIKRGEEFVWRIKLKLVNSWVFRSGVNVAGDRLGGFELSDIECILRRLAPAHTHLVFSYLE